MCNAVTGLLAPTPDSQLLAGALVAGPDTRTDRIDDHRPSSAARVGIDNNAGLSGALAGVALYANTTWQMCQQNFGVLTANPVCMLQLQNQEQWLKDVRAELFRLGRRIYNPPPSPQPKRCGVVCERGKEEKYRFPGSLSRSWTKHKCIIP